MMDLLQEQKEDLIVSGQNDPMTICCGRPITRREFEEIRETVKLFEKLSRKELSQTICEHLNWRTASGTNKLDACMKMLRQFEKNGWVKLPIKQSQSKPRQDLPVFSAKTDPGQEISGKLKEIGLIHIDLVTTPAQARLWNEYMARYHYLGYSRPFGYFIRYFIHTPEQVLGCCLFAGAAKAIAGRDQWIGWDAGSRLRNLAWIINNTRFLIFPWVNVKNLASHVLGKISRQIRQDWQDRWGFSPVLMETFVDPEYFQGTCYLAANWICLGMTTGKGLVRKNKTYQTQPKKIFVKPLIRNFRDILQGVPTGPSPMSGPVNLYQDIKIISINPDFKKGATG